MAAGEAQENLEAPRTGNKVGTYLHSLFDQAKHLQHHGAAFAEVDEMSGQTTVMVSDIPSSISQQDLVHTLQREGFGRLFNFVYIPMNLKHGLKHSGFGFVNFVNHIVAEQAMGQMRGLESTCAAEVGLGNFTCSWGACQGLSHNFDHYRRSPLKHEMVPARLKPAFFDGWGHQLTLAGPTMAIQTPQEANTTVMMSNLSWNLSYDDIVQALGALGFADKYDFVHLPMDLPNSQSRKSHNRGYCFVKFKRQVDADECDIAFNGFPFPGLTSTKLQVKVKCVQL